jgi:hypothetical protein
MVNENLSLSPGDGIPLEGEPCGGKLRPREVKHTASIGSCDSLGWLSRKAASFFFEQGQMFIVPQEGWSKQLLAPEGCLEGVLAFMETN